MSKYMLLLYAADGDEVTQSTREAAVLVSNAALRSVDSATVNAGRIVTHLFRVNIDPPRLVGG
jgi:hypothetical protein